MWLAYPGSRQVAALEAWDHCGREAGLGFVDQYQGWTYPWLDVNACLPRRQRARVPIAENSTEIRPTGARPVTLIGDAPIRCSRSGAQAGSRRWVDGRMLAAALMASRVRRRALTHYRNERIAARRHDHPQPQPRIGAIPCRLRGLCAGGFQHIDVLSQEEIETRHELQKAAGFDVDTVNSRDGSFVDAARGAMRTKHTPPQFLQLVRPAAAMPLLPAAAHEQSYPTASCV